MEALEKTRVVKDGTSVPSCVFACAPQSVGWPASAPRFPPPDPVREAGARTDSVLVTPACSSPPSLALRPRVAARSPMRGDKWTATKPMRHRRACASLVASLAADVAVRRGGAGDTLFAPARLIAAFRCDAPARCGAFGDEWRIVAAMEAGA